MSYNSDGDGDGDGEGVTTETEKEKENINFDEPGRSTRLQRARYSWKASRSGCVVRVLALPSGGSRFEHQSMTTCESHWGNKWTL